MNKPLKVLIFEGSEDEVKSILKELQLGGFDTVYEWAETIAAMETSLEGRTWDAIIANYTSKHPNSPAAVKLLRNKGLDLPFIIVSTLYGEDIAVEAMKAGASDYIMKDDLSLLVPSVENVLSRSTDHGLGNVSNKSEDSGGNPDRICQISTDITLRKNIEEELRKFSRIVEQSPAVVVITDIEGVIEYVNPRFVQTTGYTVEEAVGKTPAILKSGKTPSGIYKKLWKTIKDGREWQGELCNKMKNGDLYWESAWISPLRNQEGIITNLVGFKEDITKRKLAEEKLVTYQEQLKRLSYILSLTEERERRHISEFLHNRIGQSLTVIKMKLSELRDFRVDIADERVLDEVRGLLDNAIQDTRTLMFEISPLILYDLGFGSAVEWLIEQFGKRHKIPIAYECKGDIGMVGDDEGSYLFKSLRELLFNAVKYASAGSIKVLIQEELNKIRVSVEDDGVGFDPSKVQLSVENLSGFGLFSMRERMEHFSGVFDIESEPGQGTCITLEMSLGGRKGER